MDPFEPQDGGEDAPIRTLVAVGDLQLGVVRDSKIKDEPGLKRTLAQIGDGLQKRALEAQSPGAHPTANYQEMLDGYHEELGKYMDGDVEIRGPGWTIGLEVGPPKTLEEAMRRKPR